MTRFITIAVSFLLAASAALASPLEKRAFTGKATWTYQGLGACGTTATDDQIVTAVQAAYFDSYPGYNGQNPNKNPLCGKSVTATYQGKTVTAVVTDRSVGGSKYDLNFSPAAFSKLASTDDGVIYGVSWVQNA